MEVKTYVIVSTFADTEMGEERGRRKQEIVLDLVIYHISMTYVIDNDIRHAYISFLHNTIASLVKFMLAPCEVATKSVVPAMRAFISKELTQSYKMKQSDVAGLLGITQAAVSKYTRQVRGAVIKIDQTEEIRAMMQRIAQQLAEKQLPGPQLSIKLCKICKVVRQKGLMCQLCKRSDPTLDVGKCHVCKSEKSTCMN